nr:MAG TPA: hypothetical protein [Caudoviricetes sp.]
MTSLSETLSASLGSLLEQFQPRVNNGVHLSREEVSNIVLMLATMQRLSISMEHELTAHRLVETNRFGRDMVENIAGDQFGKLLAETDGKIIRLIFKKDK